MYQDLFNKLYKSKKYGKDKKDKIEEQIVEILKDKFRDKGVL